MDMEILYYVAPMSLTLPASVKENKASGFRSLSDATANANEMADHHGYGFSIFMVQEVITIAPRLSAVEKRSSIIDTFVAALRPDAKAAGVKTEEELRDWAERLYALVKDATKK